MEMASSISFVYILPFLIIANAFPWIFDESVKYCNYLQDGTRHLYIETLSKTQAVRVNSTHLIYFKSCGSFVTHEECPSKSVACIKDVELNQTYGLGTHLNFSDEGISMLLVSKNAGKCEEYSIAIQLESRKDKSSFIAYDNKTCTYKVATKYSKIFKKTECGLYINGKYIDFDPLDITYTVNAKEKNFSIKLCGLNPQCGEGNNACEITNDTLTPISLTSSLQRFFLGEENIVVIYGKTLKNPNNRTDKKFEVFLKCDWDKIHVRSEDLKYVPKPKQGHKFTFELNTLYGCVKRSMPCVVQDQNFLYNLTGLYIEHPEAWMVHHPKDKSRTFYLNTCNPIAPTEKTSGCKNKYTETCEIVDGTEINIGSTLTHLQLVENDNIIRATIQNGAKCRIGQKESQRMTVINFSCSFENSDPIYDYEDNCTVYFSWKTKYACPYYIASTCNSDHKQIHNCKMTVEGQNFEFDAPKPIGENLVFQFNLCGEVIEKEAPCMRGFSVIMKNLSEPNVKRRIVSLGKLSNVSINNKTLVFEYNTGHYCEYGDYKSEIRVECSDIEYEPIVADHQKKCHYIFLWRTKYGCPLPKQTIESKRTNFNVSSQANLTVTTCLVTSQLNNFELNLQNVSSTFLKHEQCPNRVEFNKTSKFVKLYYSSVDICRSVPSTNISYQVYLICQYDNVVIPKNNDCQFYFGYNKMEYCNFFERENNDSNVGLIVGSSIGCLFAFAAIAGISFWKRRRCVFYINRDELINIYERNTEL
ncbi:cation-independent mannose-6-phosphate receptor-like [Anthonomus grandis grandis]|uniref:cation-independent mannose-6-phosphate receptor-like n=1 Tax=Anthonomus grandis grandis TaxID=2921223 RepID=UPI00216558DA|nr:cation-independent mannose-6-phosphate receptor-like [Anthonomus grandis grandis]XP_050296560.1 cation-independent mannose-6-phosphate receptor-like [Anthonomus grandis grandis]